MRSMQWQLGILGTISAFAFRHRETKKNLCRDGRLQDLPNTDFQPAVRDLKLKSSNAHTVQQIHITYQHTQDNYNNTQVNQRQLHTRQLKTSYKTHETNQNRTCTKGKKTQVRQYCVQFPVIVFLIINSLTLSPQSFTSHHLLLL